MPDVTVVTPTFHRERMLRQTLQSVLAQRGVTFEAIVVDDSPEGSAAEAVDALGDPRLRFVRRREPSAGRPAVVRQQGLERASGRYVHFLDDDDLLEDGALAALVTALERRGDAGVAVGRITPFGGDARSLAHERAYFARAAELGRGGNRLSFAASLLFDNAPVVCSACLVRRDVALATGWDPELPLFEDGDFVLRAVRATGYVYVDRPIVRYRTGAPSLMRDAARDRAAVLESYRRIHAKYRAAHGALEVWALRVVARMR